MPLLRSRASAAPIRRRLSTHPPPPIPVLPRVRRMLSCPPCTSTWPAPPSTFSTLETRTMSAGLKRNRERDCWVKKMFWLNVEHNTALESKKLWDRSHCKRKKRRTTGPSLARSSPPWKRISNSQRRRRRARWRRPTEQSAMVTIADVLGGIVKSVRVDRAGR